MDSFSHSTFAYYFLSLLMEGAPFILLGTMLSGFIDVYMPSGMLERVLPKRKIPAILACGFLGIILPVCECAVVPVIRRLVAKGLPVSCAFTYMLAAPIVNPITILSTWSAFNEQQALYVTLSRIGIGYLVAVAVGLIVMWVPIEKVIREELLKRVGGTSREKIPVITDSNKASDFSIDTNTASNNQAAPVFAQIPSLDLEKEEQGCCGHEHSCSHDHTHDASCGHTHSHEQGGSRVVAAMRSGMKDFVDVAVYFTIGVCLTAMFNILQVDYYETINSFAGDTYKGTAMLMVLAFVLSVCSTSDAFLAATLGTFSYASRMAFMVFGPMLDVKLLFLYQTVMKKRFMLVLCVSLFFGVGAVCIAWEQWEWLFEACKRVELLLSEKGGAL